jgi:hypothetical protein
MLRFLRADGESFSPEEAAILAGAFEDACRSVLVELDGGGEATLELLARRIVETAKKGEFDRDRLVKDALDYLAARVLRALQHPPPSSIEGAA